MISYSNINKLEKELERLLKNNNINTSLKQTIKKNQNEFNQIILTNHNEENLKNYEKWLNNQVNQFSNKLIE